MSYRNRKQENNKRWSTKDDILKDLAEVTGRYMDVDENYIAVDGAPPPARRCDEDDDEYNLRFSGAINPYEMRNDNKPDLHGISKMLRMLDDDDIPARSFRSSPKKRKEVITISKLNPNVPEFFPKGAIDSSGLNIVNKESFNVNDKSKNDEMTNEKKVDLNDSTNDHIKIDKKLNLKLNDDKNIEMKKLDVTKLNADEIKDMSLKLRNEISNVSNKDDFHTKKKRNVAIAALLKLNTAPRVEPEVKPIKLFTPDYFTRRPGVIEGKCEIGDVTASQDSNAYKNEATISKIDHLVNLPERSVNSPKNEASIPKQDQLNCVFPKSIQDTPPTSSTKDDASTLSGNSTPKSYLESAQEIDHFPNDPEIQKSIKKVTSWLQKPESPKLKGPVVCLEPISYKKKSVKSPVSGESSSRSSSSLAVTANPIPHFVPSKRAEDLSKKYSEQAQAREKQTDDIWTQAMKKMKAKEKKMSQQAKSQSDIRENDDSSVVTDVN